RVADVQEATQETSQLDRPLDRVAAGRLPVVLRHSMLEAVALDEPHGVIRATIVVVPQAVDRYDPRVLQPAGDLRLDQEPNATFGVVGMLVADLLQRPLAAQFLVAGDEDASQSPLGVETEDAEPAARRAGVAVERGRALGVAVAVGAPVRRAELVEAGLH